MSETFYKLPGKTFFAGLDGAPTGMVGTLGVRVIRQEDNVEVIPRTTSGIEEVITNSGIYSAELVGPEEQKAYWIVWDHGGTFVTDELIITNSIPEVVVGAYDVTTPVGKVRMLISDVGGKDGNTFLFADSEIETFIELRQFDVFSASALALRTIAGNEAQLLKVITVLELETDGSKVAKALRELASDFEEMSDDQYEFDIAEMGVDLFSRRQIFWNALERGEGG